MADVAKKAPLTFRMVKAQTKEPHALGPYIIECSRGGEWTPGLQGMEPGTATAQMKKLEGKGAGIAYNEHFAKGTK